MSVHALRENRLHWLRKCRTCWYWWSPSFFRFYGRQDFGWNIRIIFRVRKCEYFVIRLGKRWMRAMKHCKTWMRRTDCYQALLKCICLKKTWILNIRIHTGRAATYHGTSHFIRWEVERSELNTGCVCIMWVGLVTQGHVSMYSTLPPPPMTKSDKRGGGGVAFFCVSFRFRFHRLSD
jgi:hypothetical protein